MKKKDYHEKLIRYYEFQLGKMPNRAAFKQALKSTFSVEDLKVFFLLPFVGMQTEEKFRKKAARIGLEPDKLIDSARRLIPAGVIDSYVDEKKGRMFGRAPFIALLEFHKAIFNGFVVYGIKTIAVVAQFAITFQIGVKIVVAAYHFVAVGGLTLEVGRCILI